MGKKPSPPEDPTRRERQIMDVFFHGSLEQTVSGLFEAGPSPTEEELQRLETLIRHARNQSPRTNLLIWSALRTPAWGPRGFFPA